MISFAGQFAELLEAAGVDTIKEFRHRVAANLYAKLAAVNAEKKLCKHLLINTLIDMARGSANGGLRAYFTVSYCTVKPATM